MRESSVVASLTLDRRALHFCDSAYVNLLILITVVNSEWMTMLAKAGLPVGTYLRAPK